MSLDENEIESLAEFSEPDNIALEDNENESITGTIVAVEESIKCDQSKEAKEYSPDLQNEEKENLNPGLGVVEETEVIVEPATNECNSLKEHRENTICNDNKSHPSPWSYSQWSENYESLDDERTVEDLNGDPKKLILWAAEKNELDTLRKLLEEDSQLINARDSDNYTPLHRASYSNNVEVIKILLSYRADVSAITSDGWMPLHCACKWDSVEAVSLLLQNGADVNATTNGKSTPLHLAASNAKGRRTLELLLWQPYLDASIQNKAGDAAFDIAHRTGPLGTLFEILEESLNVY